MYFLVCQNQHSCECKFDCPIKLDWICGDDGKSYLNECELNRTRCESTEVIEVNHKGQCVKNWDDEAGRNRIDECNSIVCGLGTRCKTGGHQERPICVCSNLCPSTTSEVCGSDNVTYQNVCYMKALACKRERDVFIKKTGPCYRPIISKCTITPTCTSSAAYLVSSI